ncbi:3'-5' exonuclease domain similar to epsilon subunit of DNA polymerase III [Photobacterium aphoticum]|uniref:3'-5' exonuclease domain similar to epsilon subunit of DNA polymerase III n=1 Tax=Photobacterium aphoticum TaxID=754436 RepID=A0A090RIE1_9GAMM|nr:3'-5' exonuclease domain similar to epsilon subunit of DNA polymerase III [Photobacterium aphoticum]
MNTLQRWWYQHRYRGTDYAPLFARYQGEELVSLDCETTSLDPQRAELVTIAATRIRANRILTSQSLHLTLRAPTSLTGESVAVHGIRHQDCQQGLDTQQALATLLAFIGNRPLVGYHIRYDKTILDRYFRQHFDFPLPNKLVEISHLYHEQLERQLPNAYFDLSLEAISRHLDLPVRPRHDALQDTITAAMIYVRLTHGDRPALSLLRG